MSQLNSSGRGRRTAFTLATAAGGAVAAAMLSMGMAHADTPDIIPVAPLDDGFQVIFGAPGTTGITAAQGATDKLDDANLLAYNSGDETALTNDADLFQVTGSDHGLEQLIFAIDPSAYAVQSTTGIDGYLTGADAGDYLVPDNALGFLGTDLDFFLLTPTGLDPGLLGPLIDTLLGFPPGGLF
jgi:hypothetical protein